MAFRDRVDAGRRLAGRLGHLAGGGVVVLGLPRGGVPVAAEIAAALGADLDVILVRKLGVPGQRELGMGAIGEDGVRVVNDDIVRLAGVDGAGFAAVEDAERAELDRRARLVRPYRPRVPLAGRTALIVDDGIATGSTAIAACAVARAHGAARVVVAVPVAPPDAAGRLAHAADELVCLETPPAMSSIGEWYDDFGQTTDEEVVSLLRQATEGRLGSGPLDVVLGPLALPGVLAMPPRPIGIVVFAHGSGSSRTSARNRQVAEALNRRGLATLLFDLLTPAEAADRANVFDVELLGRRLADVTLTLAARPGVRGLPVAGFERSDSIPLLSTNTAFIHL